MLEEFHDACRTILLNRHLPALNYAVSYADHGLSCYAREECRVQALYIVSNIVSWRGDEAKAVRETMKKAGQDKNW